MYNRASTRLCQLKLNLSSHNLNNKYLFQHNLFSYQYLEGAYIVQGLLWTWEVSSLLFLKISLDYLFDISSSLLTPHDTYPIHPVGAAISLSNLSWRINNIEPFAWAWADNKQCIGSAIFYLSSPSWPAVSKPKQPKTHKNLLEQKLNEGFFSSVP